MDQEQTMHSTEFMARRTPAVEVLVKEIAKSTTAGIWRIKRAKLVLGAWSGCSVDRLVNELRVPPQSIMKCLKLFGENGLCYFDIPSRKPTARESSVEKVLDFLNQQQGPRKKGWHSLSVHYIGRDFTAYEIRKLRTFIDSNPHLTRSGIAREVCLMFDLYQSNGMVKQTTATNIIKRMAMDNIVRLPPSSYRSGRGRGIRKPGKNSIFQPSEELTLSTKEIPELTFVSVDSPQKSVLWRELMDRFHYINGNHLFGHQLRYLVYGGGKGVQPGERNSYLLGALAFTPREDQRRPLRHHLEARRPWHCS